MDWGSILIAAGTFLTALIGALIGAVVMFMNNWHRNQQEVSLRAIEEYKELVTQLKADLKEQSSRFERLIDGQQRAINHLYSEVMDAQLEAANLHGWLQRMSDIANRLAERLRLHNENPESIPALPALRPTREPSPDFVRRSAAQNASLIKEIVQPTPGELP